MTAKSRRSNPVTNFSDEELFDDCPICQAMKKAHERGYELSYEELQAAFAKANKQQSSKPN